MPKATRSRASAHQPSVNLRNRSFAVGEKAVEHVDTGAAHDTPAGVLLQEIAHQDAAGPSVLTKKEKLAAKRDAFMSKLDLSKTHSKSHERRKKRKAKEQLASGMSEIQTVLADLEELEDPASDVDQDQADAEARSKATAVSKSLKIGAGKAETLGKAQRKKALQLERLRQPLIITNPSFSANPFSTVRLHAQNTLVKHKPAAP